MKGMIILANGFEDTEAITTIDILKRAGLQIDIVSINDTTVVTQYGLQIIVPHNLSQVNYNDYDFLVIPGGGAVKKVLLNTKVLDEVILSFAEKNKLIACICAAPMTVGKLGLYAKEKFTCFTGCNEGIEGKYTGAGVTISNNFITAKSMAYTIDFALAIVEKLLGKDIQKKISNSIYSK